LSAVRELDLLISAMLPELRPDRFVFATVPDRLESISLLLDGASPVATVREDEGTTLILTERDADRLGLPYDFTAAMITLRVHSALEAVGLTAAVSGALADAQISCNVVAGFFHDHLFVPVEQGERALAVLRALTEVAAAATRGSSGRRSAGRAAPSPSASG